MKSDFTVRVAETADSKAVAALEALIFSDPWSEDSIATLTSDGNYTVLVADRGGSVAAYMIGSGAAGESEILRIASSPEFRRLGAAGALLDSFISARRHAGDETVFLEVRASNAAAQGLYLSRGFDPYAARRGYYKKPTEDAVLMRLELGK